MYLEILQNLGLSPNEAKIYEALLDKGESTISEIAVNAKIHRRNAYDAINRLLDKGLCFQIVSTSGDRYHAVDPSKLKELLAEREKSLQIVLPSLEKKFHTTAGKEEAFIYKGFEGQKNIFRDMLRVGKDSYVIGAKGGWYDSRIENARKEFFKEAKKKKINFIQLFDYGIRELKDFPKHFEGPIKYKILPKEYSTNSLIHIFGDYVVTYTGLEIGIIKSDTVFFVIKSKDLAESYRQWFWYIWEQTPGKK
jgi:sugar-specific transcriptional regulator TrmB